MKAIVALSGIRFAYVSDVSIKFRHPLPKVVDPPFKGVVQVNSVFLLTKLRVHVLGAFTGCLVVSLKVKYNANALNLINFLQDTRIGLFTEP